VHLALPDYEVVLAAIVATFAWCLHECTGQRRPRSRARICSVNVPEQMRVLGATSCLDPREMFTLFTSARKYEFLSGKLLSSSRGAIGPTLRLAASAAERLPSLIKRARPNDQTGDVTAPMHTALEFVPVAIVGIDRSGKIEFANAKARELFGYGIAALTGMSVSSLISELPPAGLHTGANNALSGPEALAVPTTQTFSAKRRNGTAFPAEVTTRRCDVDSVPTLLAVIVDRSGRYELDRNRLELAHLTRNSALGELAGSLAHELNQPLTAILSNSQAAQRFMEADPINVSEVKETLKDIVADDCRASEIIRKMRALCRKGEVELQSLDVGSVVRDVIMLVHGDAVVRRIRTSVDIAADLPVVRGDKVHLQQVVLNLLLNAFDAVHECPVANRMVDVRVTGKPGEMLRIAVRDCGQGLTVDQMDKIFKPFFTSKPHGLGLGLSISRHIVVAHGGWIWAENNDERGATFYISLPTDGTVGPDRT
jgi:two-component system sensor kinase FixL